MADNVNWNGWVTPDLARDPGLASDVFNSKQPDLTNSVLSYANKGVMVQDAINDHTENNGTQTFWSKLGNTAVTGLNWLGKPLKEIQRDYKFVHAVYADHGFLPGFAATLGVIAGGVGGAVLGGGVGAAIGADIAAAGLRKVMGNVYTDSYTKSEDENYKVSPGRDFSNALAQATQAVGWDSAAKAFRDTNTGIGKTVSGIGDLGFDITRDPVMIIGKFGQLMKAGKYLKLDKAGEVQLKYPIMDTVPGVKQFIFERSRVPLTSEQMDAVRAGVGPFNAVSRTYNRALEDIANSSAGDIAVKYPTLGATAAGRLGKLKTADEVHDFLKTSLYFGELQGTLAGQAMLPSRTLLRATLGDSKVADVLRNANVPKFIANAEGNQVLNPEWKKFNPIRIASRVYNTFTGYMPYSVDKATGDLSLTKFKWDANDSATVIYRIAKFGMGDQAAKEMAGQYAQAVATNDLALARSIKNHTLVETFKALGLPEDSAFVTKISDKINEIGIEPVSGQIYGVSPQAETLGRYVANDVNKVGGLFENQAATYFDIPDFFAIRKAMSDAGLISKFMNGIDEFTANTYTNKIFKPLALATAGFGLRVAAAEMIPTFARYGLVNTFKAKLAASVAKQNYDLIPKETNSIFSAALVGLGAHMGLAPDVMTAGFPAFQEAKRRGLNFAAKMLPDEQLEIATRLILANEGHLLKEAVSTGHGYDASTRYQMNQAAHYYYQIQKNSPLFRDLPEYTTYSPSDTHFVPRYVTNLNKAANETANKNIAQDLLDRVKEYKLQFKKTGEVVPVSPKLTTEEFYNTPEYLDMREYLINKEYARMSDSLVGKYKPYESEQKVLTRWKDATSSGSLRQFAQDRVDATLGLFMGKDGYFHQDFAQNVASGIKTDLNDVAERASTMRNSMPAAVAGPMLQPYVPSRNPLEFITNLGFKKVIDPIVNGLAREPLYVLHTADAYGRLAPQIAKGFLTEGQALSIAQTQSIYSMLPQIHNTALRNQFAQFARNFLPFYFAQEQAIKRAYNSLKDTSFASPLFSKGMRFYQLAEHALSDPSFVQSDDNGQRYIYLPLTGEFGKLAQNTLNLFGVKTVSGLPISGKGNLISLKSVLPELQTPGVSPVLAVSGNLISDLFPSTTPVVQGTIGDISFDRAVLDSLVPATWAKSAVSALTPIDFNRQMANAVSTALAAAYYHNQVPDATSNAQQRQEFIDRIRNNARSVLLVKSFLGLVSPLAPQVSVEDAGFRDEFWKLVKQKGNFSDALVEFLGNHGTRAVSYTVAKTESNVPGAKYPYIQPTLDFMRANADKFGEKSPVSTGYFFLIPQEGLKEPANRTVYNELMTMHVRSIRTPEELLKQFYISQGDAMMSDQIKQHVQNLKDAQFSPALRRIESDRWSAIMDKMKNFYPLWYADYTSPDRRINAQTALNQLELIFSPANTDKPNHPQAQLVEGLLRKYQNYKSQMDTFNMLNLRGGAATITKQGWEDYLLQLEVDEPRLKSVIDGVFRKLG